MLLVDLGSAVHTPFTSISTLAIGTLQHMYHCQQRGSGTGNEVSVITKKLLHGHPWHALALAYLPFEMTICRKYWSDVGLIQ